MTDMDIDRLIHRFVLAYVGALAVVALVMCGMVLAHGLWGPNEALLALNAAFPFDVLGVEQTAECYNYTYKVTCVEPPSPDSIK